MATPSRLSTKDYTTIAPLSAQELTALMDRADHYAALLKAGQDFPRILTNKVVMNLFFENSTRTRTSFEMAALRLGAKVINWNAATSSMTKDETFDDTIANLAAMDPDAIVIRHKEFAAPDYVAARVPFPVANAGDSWRAHPSQALLDAVTIRQAKGRIEGLTIAICGDLSHSRVAGSDIEFFAKMGARTHLIAPPSLMRRPDKLPAGDIHCFETLEDGLLGCDIVMMLRVQKERMEDSEIPDDAAYFARYGLTSARLGLAKPDAHVMHPGPLNRGVEIADDVADDPQRSLILTQVANGVPARMAIFEALIG